MDDTVLMTLLLDFYGGLLDEKQFTVMDLYYNENQSLTEIAEVTGITRQGVSDRLIRSRKKLTGYEDKLKLAEKFISQRERLREIIGEMDSVNDLTGYAKTLEVMERVKDKLQKLSGEL